MCMNVQCVFKRERKCILNTASLSKRCWFDGHISVAAQTSQIHAIDPSSKQLNCKLPLNYLIDQLEKPSSIWARRGNSLWDKQGGVVCHKSTHSLSLQEIFNYKRLVLLLHPPSIFHLHPDKPRPLPLGLMRENCRHSISCFLFYFLSTNPLCRSFF